MARSRAKHRLLSAALALGGLNAGAAMAQTTDLSGPTSSRAAGATLPTAPGGTGLASPSAGPSSAAGTAASVGLGASPLPSGAARRAPKRPTTKRTRPPTIGPIQGGIRSTLIAPEVAANVQPPQIGLPDVASQSLPAPKRPIPDDPYAPLGIRTGGVTWFPLIGESLGYDTNPNRTRFRQGSFLSQTEGELRVQSDWSRHELTGNMRAAYNEYPDNSAASRPEGAGRLGLRIDVERDTQVNVEGRYAIDTQRTDSPDLNATVRERPIVATEGASIGVTQRFNRLIATLRGNIDRTDYEDARLSSGLLLDQTDRNLTQYGLQARLGYEFNPGFVPFIEGLADTRVYDRRVDDSGYRRSSDGFGARIGTTFEITRILTGEIGAGFIQRSYDDPRLRNLTSPLIDGALIWAMTPLTTVKASVQARVDETTVIGSTGIQVVRGSLEISHDLRRNLTVTAGLTASNADYQGVSITERGFGALLRADYRLTRQIAIRASYNYEQLHSTVANSSYATNVFLLGMRLQP